jgi:capsid protein
MSTMIDKRRVILGPGGDIIRQLEDQPMQPQAAWGGYEGALTTTQHKWVYMPPMGPRSGIASSEEVDSMSRTELLTRIAHLYRNRGKPRRIINCITRMVTGTGLMPEPMTKDTRYNDAVRKLWLRHAESPQAFSISGKWSSSTAQRALKRAQLKTGDSALVPARDREGRLRFMLYDGAQIGDGTNKPAGMYDGVLCDATQDNRPLAYRFLGRDVKGKLTQKDVDAQNVLFFCSREGIGWNRGVTCLAHAVLNLRSIDEIDDAHTHGIKSSAQYAWTIETAAGQPASVTPGAPGTGIYAPPRPQTIVEDPTTKKPIILEKMLSSGQIEELKPGQSLKILHDQRPHPNIRDHETELIRDIALGTDYPFEVLWRIDALGGANTRFVLADCQSKIQIDQEEMVEQVLAPAYILMIQDWEAAGMLPPCEDPEWWMHEWLAPARLTVDFGRDGRIYIEQWKQGHITLKTLFGYSGDGWKRQTTQWLEELAWKKAEMQRLGLTREDLPVSSISMSMNTDTTTGEPQARNSDLDLDDDL